MATGDSILTAIAVAKDCNILYKDFETIYYGDIEIKNQQPQLIWKNSERLVHAGDSPKLPMETTVPSTIEEPEIS